MTKIYISPSSQQSNIYSTGGSEETYMNQIANVLCPELTRHGIEWKRNNPSGDYNDFVAESNAYAPDYHIPIHSNAGGGRGCTIFCYNPSDVKSKGYILSKNIYKYLEPLTPTTDRGIKSGATTLSEVAKTTAPCSYLEIEFHDNLEGAQWIISHINEIATAILHGILDTVGIQYIPIVVTPPTQSVEDYKVRYDLALASISALKLDKKTLTDEVTKQKEATQVCSANFASQTKEMQIVAGSIDFLLLFSQKYSVAK